MRTYQLVLVLVLSLSLALLFSACRPPELEGAVVHYNAGRIDQAYELAMKASDMYPENPEVWYYLGAIQGQKGMIKDMVESFDKSLAINATFETQIENEKRSYFGKHYNDGVAAYNTFIQIEDKQSDAAAKKLDALISNFEKALLIKKDYMSMRLMSIAYANKNDDANSLKYLEMAKDTRPDTVLAWVELGYYYSRNKEWDKAVEYFNKGLEIDPDNVECLTMVAQNLDFADRKDEAIAAYKRAIEKNPEEKAIPFNLGLLLNKQANATEDTVEKNKYLEEAAIYFKAAHDLDPELQDVYDILSAVLLQLERYDEAEELLNTGIERFPDSANMWQNLSFLYAKQGKKDAATEAYEKSKQLRD